MFVFILLEITKNLNKRVVLVEEFKKKWDKKWKNIWVKICEMNKKKFCKGPLSDHALHFGWGIIVQVRVITVSDCLGIKWILQAIISWRWIRER